MSRYISPDDLERFEALETRQTIRKSRPSRKEEDRHEDFRKEARKEYRRDRYAF